MGINIKFNIQKLVCPFSPQVMSAWIPSFPRVGPLIYSPPPTLTIFRYQNANLPWSLCLVVVENLAFVIRYTYRQSICPQQT